MMNRNTTILLSLAAAVLLACGGGERPAPPAPAPAPAAQTPSVAGAEKVVADLYRDHAADQGPFFQTENRERLDRYFTPELADLIWKDAVAASGEAGALDFDPLYASQDFDAKNLAVHPAQPAAGNARVVVTFDNYGTSEQITYALAPAGGAWKIADVIYGEGHTLRGIFTTPAP